MIDIRTFVEQIAQAKDAKDRAAFVKHTHNLVRDYGQNLLLNLAGAIAPSTPEEIEVVKWLQDRLVAVAKQIPEA